MMVNSCTNEKETMFTKLSLSIKQVLKVTITYNQLNCRGLSRNEDTMIFMQSRRKVCKCKGFKLCLKKQKKIKFPPLNNCCTKRLKKEQFPRKLFAELWYMVYQVFKLGEWGIGGVEKLFFEMAILNVSTTPLWQWGFRQRLPFSWTTLRDKHCWHPIVIMEVVDMFGQYINRGQILLLVYLYIFLIIPPWWL